MSDLIPIDEIEPYGHNQDAPVVPRTLSDDPHTGDGSAGRPGVDLGDDEWKLRKLSSDRLQPLSDPFGNSAQARKTKLQHERSRNQRGEKKRRHRKVIRALVGLLVVGAAVFGAYLGLGYATEQWGGYVIPNVVGLSQSNAIAELEDKGFVPTVEHVEADEVQGHVVSSVPAAGTRTSKGTEVKISVSENRHIPDVVGLTREQAVARLSEAGANNIRFQARVLLEEEDRVLEIKPEPGAVFMSTEEITLVVGQLPIVPDVAGLTEAEAREVLNREGLPVLVEFEPAGFDGRLISVRTDPAAGEKAGENGVILYMGDPLVAVPRLADYFDADSAHINDFLVRGGFKQEVAYKNKDAHLVARYDDAVGGSLAFCYDPWSQEPSRDKTEPTDIMSEAVRIEGVRLSIAPIDSKQVADKLKEAGAEVEGKEVELEEGEWAEGTTERTEESDEATDIVIEPMLSLVSPKVGEAVALEVMGICGFENILDSCTDKDIKLPPDTKNEGHVFYCCQGTIDDKVWTVLVRGNKDKGDEAVEVVATCLPAEAYQNIDLEPFDNRICNFVAYQDEYVG